MDEVKFMTRLDMLRALHNNYLQYLIENEVKSDYFSWKKDHLSNGEDPKKVLENKLTSDRNVKTYSKWLEIIQEKIDDIKKYIKVN